MGLTRANLNREMDIDSQRFAGSQRTAEPLLAAGPRDTHHTASGNGAALSSFQSFNTTDQSHLTAPPAPLEQFDSYGEVMGFYGLALRLEQRHKLTSLAQRDTPAASSLDHRGAAIGHILSPADLRKSEFDDISPPGKDSLDAEPHGHGIASLSHLDRLEHHSFALAVEKFLSE
jgi:hypothetical protein